MRIDSIKINNSGYIHCKSVFYSAHDVLNDSESFEFSVGVNTLEGDIDSGNWGVSYLLSMLKYDMSESNLFPPLTAVVNDEKISLDQLWEYTCYMDKMYPLFASKETVERLVLKGVEENNILSSAEDIRKLFHIDRQRFERPITGFGNEIFKAMAAIGYVNKKEVYCFPWLSKMRFDAFHGHMPDLLNILESLKKIVILPIGRE